MSKGGMTNAADYRFDENKPIADKDSVLTGKQSLGVIGKVPTCEISRWSSRMLFIQF